MKRIILIGQAPARRGDPDTPLANPKLAKLCGLPLDRYLAEFDRMNVLDYWPGKCGKGDAFPLSVAKERAAAILPLLVGRRVVFVGFNPARAFGLKIAPLEWVKFNGGDAAMLPHPSGVSHWYNDKRNSRSASRFMRSLVR